MRTVLIAITSEAISMALSSALSQDRIYICHKGPEAIKLIESVKPDVLILDLCLPVTDGFTILQHTNHTPRKIIVLTTFISEKVLDTVAALGIQSVILIPCTTEHILKQLQNENPSPGA